MRSHRTPHSFRRRRRLAHLRPHRSQSHHRREAALSRQGPRPPDLGARKLRELIAEDVDRWLVAKARTLSSNTVSTIKSILRRSITRAQARDMVKRNVVLLCGTPTGQPGRPSKSLSLDQAHALVEQASGSTIGAYVLLALLIGALCGTAALAVEPAVGGRVQRDQVTRLSHEHHPER